MNGSPGRPANMAKPKSGRDSRRGSLPDLNSRLEKRKWHFRWIPIAAAAAALLFFSIYALRINFQDHGTAEIASIRPAVPKSGPEQSLNRSPAGNAAVPAAKKPHGPRRSDQPRGRFLSSGLSEQERYLIAFVEAISAEGATDTPREFKLSPIQIPELERIQALQIPEPEIPSIEIEALHIQTLNGSEEPL